MQKKLLVVVMAMAVAMPFVAMADGISWSADANWLNYADDSTPLAGHISDSSVGCFVQLLWVGANGLVDSAYADGGDGTWTTDDLVIQTGWVGYGVGENGYFNAFEITEGGDVVEGRTYFARVWNAPSADYVGGDVPTGAAVRYVNSPTWVYPSTSPTFDDFDIAAAGNLATTQTPLAIPEPGILALVALGVLGIRFARKRS